jgi:hypothetical protein
MELGGSAGADWETRSFRYSHGDVSATCSIFHGHGFNGNFWAKTSVTGASLRASTSKYCVEIWYGKSEPKGKCLVKRELAMAEIWLLGCHAMR